MRNRGPSAILRWAVVGGREKRALIEWRARSLRCPSRPPRAHAMSTPFGQCAQTVGRLYEAVCRLHRAAELLQLGSLEGREWFDLMRQKLLPQLRQDPFLVVAVVGGTNIGKSVIFNHLAGCRASATSPLASGTKHPVCLVPPAFADRHDLQQIFSGFEVRPWTDPEAALRDSPTHYLFWRTSPTTPPNLLVLDTPDIDSDAQVNWQRAEHIRRAADVLIAVLTQQKYNDAAVKRFFRQAADEDKAVIVVFNQCQLPEDEDYWPAWLETFCTETGIEPEFVYIAPNDRRAAEANRLPFFPRAHVGTDGRAAEPRDLADDLARLHFTEIKLRTMRGSLAHLLDPQRGAASFLSEVAARSDEFRAAAERLSAESVARVRDWPHVPSHLLVAEVRNWWRERQEGWARNVHRFYHALGRGLTWPFREVRRHIAPEHVPPFEAYRQREWEAILRAVDEVYEKLTWMSESASPLLRPRFEVALAGRSRAELLERLRQEHEQVRLDQDLADVVAAEMAAFQQSSPELYRFCKQLGTISAAARPVVSVVLFTLGWGPAGHAVAPLVADAAAQAVVHVVADLTGGAAAAVAGETALSGAAAQGAGFLQARFRQLQSAFTAHRVGWLAQRLKTHLLGTLPDDLQRAAGLSASQLFQQVRAALDELAGQLSPPRWEPAQATDSADMDSSIMKLGAAHRPATGGDRTTP